MKHLRVAVGGFSHETNSFAPLQADMEALAAAPVLRGSEILDEHRDTRSPIAGFLATAEEDVATTVVPLVFAAVTPMGLVTDEVFEQMMAELLSGLTEQGPFDVVLLDLHGAGVSESHADMDGEILRLVRDVVGSDTIVGTTLDMHSNVSPAMVEHADVVTLYQTNPHLDTRERAADCARIAFDAARGAARPVMHLVQLPLVINILRQGTDDEPVRGLLAKAKEIRERPGVLFSAIGLGYPYSDTPKMGATVLVIADGDHEQAARCARELGEAVWRERESLQGVAPTAEEAAAMVLGRTGPTVLLDVGDNVGGGTRGDSTVLAHALRGQDGVFVVLTDRAGAAAAHAAGIGADITLTLGAGPPEAVGGTIEFSGKVTHLSDGEFTQRRASHGNRPQQHVGPTAVIACPGFGSVMITSLPFLPFSLEPYEAMGIDVSSFRVIVAKGVIAPRAAFLAITDDLILVDTPGPSTADFGRFDYTARRVPLYPFEPHTEFADAVEAAGG
jgi:microcystin degradation protein MlrC